MRGLLAALLVMMIGGLIEIRVVVVDGDGMPRPGVDVRLSAQQGVTDADGVAVFHASPGRHPIIAGTLPDALMRVVIVKPSGTQTFTMTLK